MLDQPTPPMPPGRRETLLRQLRRDLARWLARPPIDRAQYARERDYKRACTLRERCENRMRRKIKCLEEGRHYSEWVYVQLED